MELERLCGVDALPRRGAGAGPEAPCPSPPPELPREFVEFRRQVEQCERCPLHRTRKQVVFGLGPLGAPLMFVGEAPGNEEDAQGEPFVGPAGRLLTRLLRELGVEREQVYITNVVRCRPPDAQHSSKIRAPSPEEMRACFPYLLRHVRYVAPKIVCALGAVAAQAILGVPRGIGSLRGRYHERHGWRVFATYHPAYLLRNMSQVTVLKNDLRTVCRDAGLIR